jgi:hypothetical protein
MNSHIYLNQERKDEKQKDFTKELKRERYLDYHSCRLFTLYKTQEINILRQMLKVKGEQIKTKFMYI